jgi:hypothetical protein
MNPNSLTVKHLEALAAIRRRRAAQQAPPLTITPVDSPVLAAPISLEKACANLGMTVADALAEKVAPACCSEGCVVFPDSQCLHGFDSVPTAYRRYLAALDAARSLFLEAEHA